MSLKDKFIERISEDVYDGNICSNYKTTMSFIEDIVSLLTDEQIQQLSKKYNYSIERRWKKLTQEQICRFDISSYEGEVILIDENADIDERFYFNAQEFFSQGYLDSLEYYKA